MKATFENSVNVLVKAYFDGTLVNGDCFACAVGNLICDAKRLIMTEIEPTIFRRRFVWNGYDRNNDYPGVKGWGNVFCTSGIEQQVEPEMYVGEAKDQIDSTGYSWEQLAKIEFAFEVYYRGEDPMFNALCAVVDVLAEIHQIDLTVKESAKLLFVKP